MTDPSTPAPDAPRPPAPVDAARLRGLSHPLRVRILDLLQVHGSLTASRLAELVGESSGSTSYHLRQLAKHQFVREVEGKGTARERWWEATPGGLVIGPAAADDAGVRTTRSLVRAGFEQARQEKIWRLLDLMNEDPAQIPDSAGWEEAITLMTANAHATPEQLLGLVEAVQATITAEISRLTSQEPDPRSRPVQIHFNAFPVVPDDGPSRPAGTDAAGHGDPLG
ncbi:winged helix-turn-helix domain-containing protein [Isoptericola sp. b408]|uniref:winged helix-turn-helix domain-containing protein n=1 Tax=Isoptericola sp. b408 TaxID=3064653 RepID=UPI002713C24F|nr:winged helix-turn-helix domain-containing protein [Isoptericola sp. b408]MDO8152404.1 winged helix-turn-helix domain-containing protein [Isoptericola sp. b408]